MSFYRNFPYGLGILLILQFLFFFTVLLDNQSARQNAIDYYFDSGLYRIEFPMYNRFLQKYMANNIYFDRLEDISSGNLENMDLYWLIFFDPFFQKQLKTNNFLEKSAYYPIWEEKRNAYEEYLSNDLLLKTSFNSAVPKPINIIFSLFSSENIIQFGVNILFLMCSGFFLRKKIGVFLTLETYLLGGILMISTYCLLAPYSLIPVAGSNGGTASMVALTAFLLFDVRVMNYLTILSITILPLWVAAEYTLYFISEINTINLSTQIPSIIGGAVIGLYLKRSASDTDVPE